MPVSTPPAHTRTWPFYWPIPTLDIQQDFRAQEVGKLSRCTGVDGRYAGRLKRFPGFLRKYAGNATYPTAFPMIDGASNITIGSVNGLTLFKPFAMLAAPHSSQIVRGIFFLGRQSSTPDVDILYALYIVNGASSTPTISRVLRIDQLSPTGTLSSLDVTTDHQVAFIVGEQSNGTITKKVEYVARYTGSTGGWKSAEWITTPKTNPVTVTFLGLGSGTPPADIQLGKLINGRLYGYAYRYVFPDQGYFGPVTYANELSATPSGIGSAVENANVYGYFAPDFATHGIAALGQIFTRCILQVFRTVANSSDNTAERGVLKLEAEFEIPRKTSTLSGAVTTFPNATSITVPTASSAVVGDTIYIMRTGTPSASLSAGSIDEMLWDSTVFRASVTQIQVNTPPGFDTITFTPGTPAETGTEDFNAAGTWRYSLSRSADEVDTSGLFLASDGAWTLYAKIGGPTARWDNHPLTPRGLPDDSLILQPTLSPEETAIFPNGNPRARLIELYDNLFVRVTGGASADLSSEQSVIRWDYVDRPRKVLVPVLNRYRLPDLGDSVLALRICGPFLAVILTNSILRIHRSGSDLSVDTIHNRHGCVAAQGAVSVGSTLYFVSPVGILVCDMGTGQIDVINATQHFFNESSRWASSLSSIQSAYDAQIGAIIFHNTTLFETLILWLNHGVMTHLTDVPFDYVATGVDLQTGSTRRALFFNTVANTISEVDAFRAGLTRTTLSHTSAAGSYTYNGLCGVGTNSTTLVPPGGGSFGGEMVGHFVQFFNPSTGSPTARARITGFSAGNLTFSTASPAPSSGDRFAIGAIPMKVTCWPMHVDGNNGPLLEQFHHKKCEALASSIANLSGDTAGTNPNLKVRYQMFTRTAATPTKEAEGTLSGDNPAATYTALNLGSAIMVPGFEIYSSNLDLDFLGLLVRGTIEYGRRSESQ